MASFKGIGHRDIALGLRGRSPLVRSVKNFGGLSPSLNVEVLIIFLSFFYFAKDLHTHLNKCSHYNLMLLHGSDSTQFWYSVEY